MAARPQHSASSLARYATARAPDVDVFNGSQSRDYCNSFWGPGDDGPNILFTRMRGACKTTDELVNFWNERSLIEEEYALKLAKLAKVPIGQEEIGELRTSLDTLRLETEKQAETHLELARQIRDELETPTAQFHAKQVSHRRNQQSNVEKKFKVKQTQEAYVLKAKEKYDADCVRINSYTQQASYMTGKDLDRINMKLQRARQTVQANEKDLAAFTKTLLDLLPEWEAEWKNFCDSCQDLEEERLDFMKDVLWAYANDISTVCVADDASCERIRTALDQLDPLTDVENFVNEYGTGNTIQQPTEFTPHSGGSQNPPSLAPTPKVRPANFVRISTRPPVTYQVDDGAQLPPDAVPPGAIPNGVNATAAPPPTTAPPARSATPPQRAPATTNAHAPTTNGHHSGPSHTSPPLTSPPSVPPPAVPSASSNAAPKNNRVSQPLPVLPSGAAFRSQSPPPPLPTREPTNDNSNRILFYVKALYDYTATIDEEFDFQAGDVIAVTATPDDGWWSGELLDENRRVEGRHVFPSNFVCLF
ncbi:SH3 domain-containing protein [Coprinopsis cinerea okayama7|uniref:SH3 domain-containing protein n=1 Tax=Coprinopsis cinerea (strain Okayama-7 / 130 / ATCC MYA-4618 / FGSC 9003) TaxID=240176 RepID=A8N5J3_COPC7|nr:SH3 domain-containing protein [Coprinopsis cinerea okayama7\|eukprot:XP_001830138.1 SH3 domain-containing protein [Coprinopsis cinerea okayama7\